MASNIQSVENLQTTRVALSEMKLSILSKTEMHPKLNAIPSKFHLWAAVNKLSLGRIKLSLGLALGFSKLSKAILGTHGIIV